MYRSLLKHTSTYSVAILIERACGFLMLPVYTRILSTADYGAMELLNLTMSFLALFLAARAGEALFYFYFRDKDPGIQRKCIVTALLMSALTGGLIILLGMLATPYLSLLVFQTARYTTCFRLLFLGFGCSMPGEVGLCAMRAFGDSARYVRATAARVVAAAVMNLVFLLVFHMGVAGILTSAFLCSLGLALYMSYYLLAPRGLVLDRALAWQFLKYSIPLGVSSLAVFVIHYGDRAFLKNAVSLGDLGIYSLAYTFGMLISYVHSPFYTHWRSQVSAILRSPNGAQVYVRTTTYLAAVLVFACLGLSLFITPALHVLTGPDFWGARLFVPWIAAAYVMRAFGAHLQTVFVFEGRPGLEARVNLVGSLSCLAAYALLIPRFKMPGAIAATLLGFLVILIYGFWTAQRLHPFRFEYQRWARIVAIAALIVTAYYMVNPARFELQILFAAAGAAAYAAASFFGVLSREERRFAISALRQLLHTRFGQTVPVSTGD